jgi:hypothetical protein
MTGRVEPQWVTAALFIDGGQGREDKHTGLITYSKPPRARYECLLCGTKEGPIVGAAAVKAFAAHIRTTHPANCPAATQKASTTT